MTIQMSIFWHNIGEIVHFFADRTVLKQGNGLLPVNSSICKVSLNEEPLRETSLLLYSTILSLAYCVRWTVPLLFHMIMHCHTVTTTWHGPLNTILLLSVQRVFTFTGHSAHFSFWHRLHSYGQFMKVSCCINISLSWITVPIHNYIHHSKKVGHFQSTYAHDSFQQLMVSKEAHIL